jgi:hypothetical protein
MTRQLSVFTVDRNMAATNAAMGQPAWTGTTFPTSTQATPIPILWGTRRLSPNILWQRPSKKSAWRSPASRAILTMRFPRMIRKVLP